MSAAALDRLATTVMAQVQDNRPFNEIWGWNLPPLTRQDLASRITETADRLRELNPRSISEDLDDHLSLVEGRADRLRSQSVPNIPGGNAPVVVAQIQDLLEWVERPLPPPEPAKVAIDWKEVASRNQLPPGLLRRLRSIEAHLKNLEPRTAHLAETVAAIESAREAAENLPTDVEILKESRDAIETVHGDVKAAADQVTADKESIDKLLTAIKAHDTEAQKLIENIGDAYRVTTTKGLAASFASKAFWLNASLVAWVAGLILALGVGATTAAARFKTLEGLLENQISADRAWIQLVISLVGIGAPIWFAWIATKQIGQRFRLAEDYGYKASVAKAYEGYRREAARIDPAFEARLFASALTRLEEAPLRLVEHESYGSPWHELTASGAFRRALDAVPELKGKYLDIVAKVGAAGAAADAAIEATKGKAEGG